MPQSLGGKFQRNPQKIYLELVTNFSGIMYI